MNVAVVKAHLRDAEYAALTGGDDSMAEAALARGVVYVTTRVESAGGDWSDQNAAMADAAVKRGIYELFTAAGAAEGAEPFRKAAEEVLSALFGVSSSSGEGASAGGAVAKTVSGSGDWNGFR